MKPLSFFSLIAIVLLAGCAPAQSSQGTESPQDLSSDLEQTTASPEAKGNQPALVEVTWDHSPDALIVSATFCCGLAPELLKLNYIPSAQIWGDGHMIWSVIGSGGKRSVFQGTLTTDQLSVLLQDTVNKGFFGWQELYTDPLSPTDLPTKCLFIHLQNQSKKVCEYYKGAPESFHVLYDTIAQSAGLSENDYTPEKGYLVAYPTQGSDQSIPEWDAQAMGFSLSEVVNGKWVDGPALQTCWNLVNEDPWGPTVRDNGDYYQITLQVPGVSMVEPPAQ